MRLLMEHYIIMDIPISKRNGKECSSCAKAQY